MSAPVNEVFSLLQTDDFLDLIRALGEDRPPWILNLNVYTSIEDIDRSDEIFQQLVNAFVSNTSVAGLRLEADETTMLVPFLENLVPLLTPLQHIELALDCNSCAPIARVIPVIFRPQPDSAQRITRLYLMRVVFDCDFLGWVGLQNSDTLEVVKVDGCSFDVTNSMDFMDCFKNTKKHDAVGLTIASSDFEGLSSLQVAKDIFLDSKLASVEFPSIGANELQGFVDFLDKLKSQSKMEKFLPRLSLNIASKQCLRILSRFLPFFCVLRHLSVASNVRLTDEQIEEFKTALERNGSLWSVQFDVPGFGPDFGKAHVERNEQMPKLLSNAGKDCLDVPALLVTAFQSPRMAYTSLLKTFGSLEDTIGPSEDAAVTMDSIGALQVYSAALNASAAAAAYAAQTYGEATAAKIARDAAMEQAQAAIANATSFAIEMATTTHATADARVAPMDRQSVAAGAAAHAAAANAALAAATEAAAAIKAADAAKKVAVSAATKAAKAKAAATAAATTFLTAVPLPFHPMERKRAPNNRE